MTIQSFISGLLPSFGKRDVLAKIRNISKKLTDLVRPAVEVVAENLDEQNFKSAYGKAFMKSFTDVLPSRMKNDPKAFFKVVGVALDNGQKLLDLLEQYVGKNVGETIHVEGMTYQKASVIRLIELVDFFVDYTSRHLSFLVASETSIEAFKRPDGNPFTPAALRFLNDNRGNYIRVLNLLNGDPKAILANVEKIPEIVMAGTEVAEVPALAGSAADPLQLNAIPLISGLFHWAGLRLVDWEIERFEAAKRERNDIEMRLEYLRTSRTGQPDAQAEAIIDSYQRELTLIRDKIAKLEERTR